MKIDRKIRKADAYFTVEAVLILPLTLGVILLVIYLWFYQYDRCLMEQDMGMLALRGAVLQKSDSRERLEEVKSLLGMRDIDKYVAWEEGGADIKVSGGKVRVRQQGTIRFPFAGRNSWVRENIWRMETSYENKIMSPAAILRKYRRLKRGA